MLIFKYANIHIDCKTVSLANGNEIFGLNLFRSGVVVVFIYFVLEVSLWKTSQLCQIGRVIDDDDDYNNRRKFGVVKIDRIRSQLCKTRRKIRQLAK